VRIPSLNLGEKGGDQSVDMRSATAFCSFARRRALESLLIKRCKANPPRILGYRPMGNPPARVQACPVVVPTPSPPARRGNARRVGYPRLVGFGVPGRRRYGELPQSIPGVHRIFRRPPKRHYRSCCRAHSLLCPTPRRQQMARRATIPRPPGRFSRLLPCELRMSGPGRRK
jgi:hypothetical protein